MKTKIIVLATVLILTIFAYILTLKLPRKNIVCVKDKCFTVELAITPQQHAHGLMFRKKLDDDKGMFFIFKGEGIYPFWMKNTFIPLDIIWIGQNQQVVFIKENAQPCKKKSCPLIFPNRKAKYVLEVNGGTVNKLKSGVGDRVELKIFGKVKG
jgi:uncharacterized membrane protein (UPF0127 family)